MRVALDHHRRRLFWHTTSVLTAEEFQPCFRMHRWQFKELTDNRIVSLRNNAVAPEVRMAVLVRILAGASTLDLMLVWNIARSTVFQEYNETYRLVVEELWFSEFSDTRAKCEKLADGFSISRAGLNPLYGCVGALDGVAIRIRKPRTRECINPARNCHQNGFYALSVQAICDAEYRFTFFC